MKPIHYLVAFLLLTSCGPAAKLRRAEKLIAKAEEQGAQWHTDSIVVEIPVPVESVRVDTIERVLPGDSIIVMKDRLKVIVKRVTKDTIMISGECAADTIRIKRTVTINKTIKASGGIKWWWLVIAAAAGLLAGFFRK